MSRPRLDRATLPGLRFLVATFGGVYNDLIGRRSRLGAAAVIFNDDNRVLLVQHSYGRRNWELPGGGRESKESVVGAVRREVREEVGVQVIVDRLCGVYFEPETDQHHFAFVCRLLDPADIPKPSSVEIRACRYWPVDSLPRPLSDFTLRRIEDARFRASEISVVVLERRRWLD